METARLKEFLKLKERVSELDGQLTAARRALRNLAHQLDEDMALAGVQNVNVDGYTIYRSSTYRVSKKIENTMDQACDYLRNTDLAYMVKPAYAAPSLRSYVIEVKGAGQDLPAGFEDMFNVLEENLVHARKA